ncbi:uncharacterized protein GIQ15_00051 [Arthroderma uncinatum]|uniref:uncharacterized protein n=1 Tax=Arthroderma uncinatum TaxID=74035 RepID=UPI00144A53FA|nr:uncharacterized protein GIQ15_00051 [Arthroderma uncinatum]KAF3490534.1 hypothetical protein GIQ15_00051 [Arthroderma uncinatum]
MAQTICNRPARQVVGATTTASHATKSVAQNKGQEQRGVNVQTVPKPLSLRQSQALRQQQSLAFAQIMLHASFGTLFYLREFLPLSCFGERDLLNLKRPDSNVSYDDFVAGGSNPPVEAGKRGQPLKIILRDRNAKADGVLNLLEHGIFDALEKNVLEAVQLTVFVDKENPSHVLESYTFSFNYTRGVHELSRGLETVSLETTGRSTEVKTFRTAKLGLEMIIRRLITLSTFLPILPNKRFLEIHLFYTQDCPKEYEPQGFKSTTHDHIVYPRDDVWKKETQSCGVMDSGCHSVGLKVTALKCSREDGDDGDDIGGRQIPDTLEYTERTERGHEIGIEDEGPSSPVMTKGQGENSSQESAQGQESTQTRQDAITKNMLQKMVRLELPSPDSELIPTQAASHLSSNPPKADPSVKPCLSQIQKSKIKERINHSQLTQPVTGQGPQNGNGEVSCQCGWGEPDMDMLKCDFCNTRQHLTCYGFLHPSDEKIPTTHACYKCLLGPDESKISRQIETLVLLRQALKIIIEKGYPLRVKDFSQKLHCSGNEVVQITELLRKNGFLQPTPGSKQRGFAEKGLPRFRVPDSEETRRRLRQEIFNPLAKISHHYMVPSTPDSRPNNATSVVNSTMKDMSGKSEKELGNHTDLQGKPPLDTYIVLNSEPIVISEDEDNGGSQPHAAVSSQAATKTRRVSSMSNGAQVARDNAASTSPPSSPPHSQYSLASRAQEQLRRQQRGRGERSHPPVFADSQFESYDEPAKEQPYKRRKLSNAAYPIDIGDSTSEESS